MWIEKSLDGWMPFESPHKNHTLYLGAKRPAVLALMRWKYDWFVRNPESPPWTLQEKNQFHRVIKTMVRQYWNNKIKLSVSGSSHYVQQFAGKPMDLSFDVRWVTQDQHWNVTVIKQPFDARFASHVVRAEHRIMLQIGDTLSEFHCRDAPCTEYVDQPIVLHEVAHAMFWMRDEYPERNGNKLKDDENFYVNDFSALLNMGNQLRERYITSIIMDLNQIDPGNMVFGLASFQR